MRIVIDTETWRVVRWYRRIFNRAPKKWWEHHHKDCGTKHRGCSPECPKEIWENTFKWTAK